jgi:hypothetical protein
MFELSEFVWKERDINSAADLPVKFSLSVEQNKQSVRTVSAVTGELPDHHQHPFVLSLSKDF